MAKLRKCSAGGNGEAAGIDTVANMVRIIVVLNDSMAMSRTLGFRMTGPGTKAVAPHMLKLETRRPQYVTQGAFLINIMLHGIQLLLIQHHPVQQWRLPYHGQPEASREPT